MEAQHSSTRVWHAELVRREGPRVWLRFNREETTAARLIAEIVARHAIRGLTVEEPEIEAIIYDIYLMPLSRGSG